MRDIAFAQLVRAPEMAAARRPRAHRLLARGPTEEAKFQSRHVLPCARLPRRGWPIYSRQEWLRIQPSVSVHLWAGWVIFPLPLNHHFEIGFVASRDTPNFTTTRNMPLPFSA